MFFGRHAVVIICGKGDAGEDAGFFQIARDEGFSGISRAEKIHGGSHNEAAFGFIRRVALDAVHLKDSPRLLKNRGFLVG